MLKKIVSGGQTGVDRAALDISIKLGIPHGGWCPRGRKAEDGIIADCYQLKETESADYSVRTKYNVRDSDGTLIIVPLMPIKGSDGTSLTLSEAKEKNKPYLIVDLSNVENLDKQIVNWIVENKIKTLNIAGPRESQCPGIYELASELLITTLDIIKKNQKIVNIHKKI